MPDGMTFDGVRADAIRMLGAHIEELPGANELQLSTVRAYKSRSFICGWLVPVQFADILQEFHVLVPLHFPFSELRIGIPNPPPFLSWPHLEKDGILCILDRNSTISVRDPIAVFHNLLRRAVQLVESCRRGTNAVDFETEFNTYWNYEVEDATKEIRSLAALSPGNCTVRFWDGTRFDMIADDALSIKSWLARRYGKPESTYASYATSGASLVWLPRPMHPAEYPKSANDLRKIVASADALETVADVVDEAAKAITIIVAAPTPNGPVLAGATVSNPKFKNLLDREVDPLRRGFRPGRVPKKLLADRFLSSGVHVKRFNVRRIDHEWIHGRGRDPRQSVLRHASVAVLGCGSIGSEVAGCLARAGVGNAH